MGLLDEPGPLQNTHATVCWLSIRACVDGSGQPAAGFAETATAEPVMGESAREAKTELEISILP